MIAQFVGPSSVLVSDFARPQRSRRSPVDTTLQAVVSSIRAVHLPIVHSGSRPRSVMAREETCAGEVADPDSPPLFSEGPTPDAGAGPFCFVSGTGTRHASTVMTATPDPEPDSTRLGQALRLVVRRYGAQIRRRPGLALPALLLPAVGDILTYYAPPLVVARLLGAFARDEPLSAADLTPYVLTFAGLWLAGQTAWRASIAMMIRAELRGHGGALHRGDGRAAREGLSFFHNNYAGSLTKRALGYARRFEDVFDVLAFQVAGDVLPLAFVVVVLWRYSPWLVVVLLVAMLVARSRWCFR